MSAHAVAYDYESGPPIERGRLGVWLFIVGEVMFFAGLFSAWLVLRAGARDWPAAPRVDLNLGIAFTVVLLLASVAAGAATRAARRGAGDSAGGGRLTRWLFVAAALGAAFLGGQAYEYAHLLREGIAPRTDVAWGMFFLITAAHGTHVLVGVVWNLVLAWRAWRGRLPRWRARHVEYGALYQHFVDVVWLGVFAALYLVG
ncbi:MAG: heme-copper oxidase subunit III [Planctomycetota bacterium]